MMYASEKETPRITQMRHEYRNWLFTVDPHNLVFVDESGINLLPPKAKCKCFLPVRKDYTGWGKHLGADVIFCMLQILI